MPPRPSRIIQMFLCKNRWGYCRSVRLCDAVVCLHSFSIDPAVGVCPGGGSGGHGAEEHHRVLPAVERDRLRDGVGRKGSAWHSADRTLTPPLSQSLTLSLSNFICICVSRGKNTQKMEVCKEGRVQEVFGEKRSQMHRGFKRKRRILDPDTGGLKATG